MNTEDYKKYTLVDKWIRDNDIGKLLSIEFNTISNAKLCCEL